MRDSDIKQIVDPLTTISRRSKAVGAVFRDFVSLALYALCRDDERYLQIMDTYDHDRPKGERDADLFAEAFRQLLEVTARLNHDALGGVYMHLASNYSAKGMGQFFTPAPMCDMMAGLTIGDNAEEEPRILDPACGSGRMLISAAKLLPAKTHLTGIDMDRVCAHMAAVNLCLFNAHGVIYHGNSLSMEYWEGFITTRSAAGGAVRQMTEEEFENYIARDAERIEETAASQQESQMNLFNHHPPQPNHPRHGQHEIQSLCAQFGDGQQEAELRLRVRQRQPGR